MNLSLRNGLVWISFFFASTLWGQVSIAGRVVDDTGAPVQGARVEFQGAAGERLHEPASSDEAGNFSMSLGAPGEYSIRAERFGFYVYQGRVADLQTGQNQVTIVLNHLQEISQRVEVVYSPPIIDPQKAADQRELGSTEIQSIPFPAPQDFRNALPLLNGVLQDGAGQLHVNGGESSQTTYTLNGFNLADPFTGNLEARVNIETLQTIEMETSRYSADTGGGSAGALELRTKMGDDRWRLGATNIIPSLSSRQGFHINKWTPRLQLSGPILRGRAWFHNGFDAFYAKDIVEGLPHGENTTRGITLSNLTRFQVNLTNSNILTGGFMVNAADNARWGLSFTAPAETTLDHRQELYMTSLRDQQYFGGALLDFGFADIRTVLRDEPQGSELFQLTPYGARGNAFTETGRHAYRQQWMAHFFLPTVRLGGEHQFKLGIDFERESFNQRIIRRPYQILREDYSLARNVEFRGWQYQSRDNFEATQYFQDHWTVREGLAFEVGLRLEWNQIVRDLQLGPRLAVVWAPRRLPDTKFSAGWGVYHDAISFNAITRNEGQVSLSTFYRPDGTALGPILTAFRVDEAAIKAPYFRTASIGVERKLPGDFYGKVEYIRRTGPRGLVNVPAGPDPNFTSQFGNVYELRNARRDRYDALDFTLRRTFAGQYEWFAGYTRSSARTNAAVEYSLESPIFAPQAPGPYPWDAPNRFHMWGWAPVPSKRLPQPLRYLLGDTSAAYLVEYRTGFPFSAVDAEGFMVGPPNSLRMPDYFSINLHLERRFRLAGYVWAWRFGFNNITNNGNPTSVNNVVGTPAFLTYGRGQARAFSVRLRLLGRR